MSKKEKLSDSDRWLAAEYALGVLKPNEIARAEAEANRNLAFQGEVDAWHNQLSPLLGEIEEKIPPAALWKRIETEISGASAAATDTASGLGFWKWMTALSSTAAVACFGLLMFVTGGDFQGRELQSVKNQLANAEAKFSEGEAKLAAAQNEIADLKDGNAVTQSELASSRDALAAAETEIAEVQERLEGALDQVATIQEQIQSTQPLVASLTQSGDLPAFVAQYDPIRKALLIRSAVEDSDERVPELWLIPEQGDRKGEVLSMGVLDENSPNTVPVTDEFIPLIGEGGTLAISMEPPGGAPDGVATGPIIAVGKFQGL